MIFKGVCYKFGVLVQFKGFVEVFVVIFKVFKCFDWVKNVVVFFVMVNFLVDYEIGDEIIINFDVYS